jgi:hypothetical protein
LGNLGSAIDPPVKWLPVASFSSFRLPLRARKEAIDRATYRAPNTVATDPIVEAFGRKGIREVDDDEEPFRGRFRRFILPLPIGGNISMLIPGEVLKVMSATRSWSWL